MATTLKYYSIHKGSDVAIIIFFDYYKMATWLQIHKKKCSNVASVASGYFRIINFFIGIKKKPFKKKNRHYLPPLPHYDRPLVLNE
jgi:hypothetical protein